MAKPRGSSSRSIALPWERRGAWLRELVVGRRIRALLVILGLIALLGLLAQSAAQSQREQETRAAVSEIKRGVAAFRADMGRCPHTLYELMHPPRTGHRYLRQVPVDGWGRPFFVSCPGRYDPESADVVSAGPSGSFLVDDNLH